MINQMVLSTEIEWIGYEEQETLLQVEFIAGSIYQYKDVPKSIYENFVHSESCGRYFEENIKGHYPYRKIQ